MLFWHNDSARVNFHCIGPTADSVFKSPCLWMCCLFVLFVGHETERAGDFWSKSVWLKLQNLEPLIWKVSTIYMAKCVLGFWFCLVEPAYCAQPRCQHRECLRLWLWLLSLGTDDMRGGFWFDFFGTVASILTRKETQCFSL